MHRESCLFLDEILMPSSPWKKLGGKDGLNQIHQDFGDFVFSNILQDLVLMNWNFTWTNQTMGFKNQ